MVNKMAKVIDLDKTVAQLVKEYPEVKDIMASLGFKDITSPVALKVMGKVMTIKKGSAIKGIPMPQIIQAFEDAGFEVIHPDEEAKNDVENTSTGDDRVDELKVLIKRVGNGEPVEEVRKDFVKQFSSVSVHEIANAEQSLIADGMETSEVMKLCDLHSALFHGRTEAEIWAEEEQKAKEKNEGIPEGHPVSNLRRENAALERLVNGVGAAILRRNQEAVQYGLNKLCKIRTLYGKKEELIMPVLKKYDVTGPSEVMWGVDDEIKHEVSRLAKGLEENGLASEQKDILAVLDRIKEMIYKEEKILFPLALEKFSRDEWISIYEDLPEMGPVFVDSYDTWTEAEQILSERKKETKDISNGVIHFDGGTLTIRQLQALFKVLPIDITFIDDNDINTFYANEGKVFSRPKSTLGRKVYECHPAKIRPVVEDMISQFKAGTLDKMERWVPLPGKAIRILYLPVRGEDGSYIGTVEIIEDMASVKKHFKKN